MKETKAYKTYLVSTEEPTGKSKRVKRPAKKSTKAPAIGVVIRETHEMPLSKKKEKIIPLVTSKGTSVKPVVPDVTEEESSESEAESWGNDEDDSNNEQDSSGEDIDQKNDSDDDKTQSENENEFNFEHETDENESGSECDQEQNEEDEDDEEEVKDELVKTSSNNSDDEDETKITDKAEGDEDEKMDYTTIQLYDDVDIRLNEPVDTDKGFVQEEGTDAAMTNIQQGNENPEIVQVIEDAHVTLSTVPQKTEVLVTSSSHSSDLAAKFLNFSDIPYTDAEIVSPMDVHVHHEVPSKQTLTLLTIPISVISDTSPVYSTVILQSLPSFTPPPQQSTSIQPPKTEAKNPLYTLPNFASVIQFNNRVTALEKEVAELKKDPLYTQVTALVDDHLDARLGETRDEFLNFLSVSLTTRITEQKAAATLTEFELKKILIDKMDKSESYLAAPEHRECYEGLIKSYDLDKTIFSTYDRGLKKRKTSKDAEPKKGLKANESQSGSSKGDKSQSKSSGKSVQFKEGDFPRLCINDIEDMLLLVVHNRLINLSSNDVSDFALALRMFTRSLVIQKQVKDLQIGNIRIEYLPKRRRSTLEKKRANIMIKAIDKQLEERRLMMSLEKFVGGRHYGTDLWLLQRTI
ncbi:hypothetical protein Tco_1561296 [Tanacetum coccineum]